ncbi:hypothetical protein LPTSP4_14340 [Leptospira ryugenii]|uniref:Uncharacterized protein n=1 Tax=Leptospira ryugenii TaxID=1917863 RepID=A0A2P2DZ58_9LEPT|nr:hypothetical protein [Leptospira ryugenii]GBF49914.1 hypothetical protein LPTSP4_14340 [Leptospira ryugenii]
MILHFVRILLFLCFAFPLFALEIPTSTVKSKEGFYTITYKNVNVDMDLLLNGYAIRSSVSEEDGQGQADLNLWILPGKNTISLRLVPRKDGKQRKGFEPSAEFSFIIAQKGQFPSEGEVVYSYQTKTESSSSIDSQWQTFEFDPPFLPPSLLWKKAEKIQLNPELQSSALQWVKSLHKELNRKKIDSIYPYFQFKLEDTSLARYYPTDPKSDKKDIQSLLKMTGASWKLDTKDLTFTVLCDGKVLLLTNSKAGDVLTAKDGISLPLYLSLVEGKWFLSR